MKANRILGAIIFLTSGLIAVGPETKLVDKQRCESDSCYCGSAVCDKWDYCRLGTQSLCVKSFIDEGGICSAQHCICGLVLRLVHPDAIISSVASFGGATCLHGETCFYSLSGHMCARSLANSPEDKCTADSCFYYINVPFREGIYGAVCPRGQAVFTGPTAWACGEAAVALGKECRFGACACALEKFTDERDTLKAAISRGEVCAIEPTSRAAIPAFQQIEPTSVCNAIECACVLKELRTSAYCKMGQRCSVSSKNEPVCTSVDISDGNQCSDPQGCRCVAPGLEAAFSVPFGLICKISATGPLAMQEIGEGQYCDHPSAEKCLCRIRDLDHLAAATCSRGDRCSIKEEGQEKTLGCSRNHDGFGYCPSGKASCACVAKKGPIRFCRPGEFCRHVQEKADCLRKSDLISNNLECPAAGGCLCFKRPSLIKDLALGDDAWRAFFAEGPFARSDKVASCMLGETCIYHSALDEMRCLDLKGVKKLGEGGTDKSEFLCTAGKNSPYADLCAPKATCRVDVNTAQCEPPSEGPKLLHDTEKCKSPDGCLCRSSESKEIITCKMDEQCLTSQSSVPVGPGKYITLLSERVPAAPVCVPAQLREREICLDANGCGCLPSYAIPDRDRHFYATWEHLAKSQQNRRVPAGTCSFGQYCFRNDNGSACAVEVTKGRPVKATELAGIACVHSKDGNPQFVTCHFGESCVFDGKLLFCQPPSDPWVIRNKETCYGYTKKSCECVAEPSDPPIISAFCSPGQKCSNRDAKVSGSMKCETPSYDFAFKCPAGVDCHCGAKTIRIKAYDEYCKVSALPWEANDLGREAPNKDTYLIDFDLQHRLNFLTGMLRPRPLQLENDSSHQKSSNIARPSIKI